MAYYLIQAAYAADAWAALVKKPQNRVEAIRPAVEKLGGRIEGAWFCFGDYDIVLICRMPDNLSAAAFSVAAAAGGALRALKTTPLLTTEEGLEVMKKAGGVGYRPPR
ncbi:MAG: GYD domain-containing protein [Verrucomicrobia bacterium]|nr:MAG: GYD domain-containing protein [Verrucomicrobiota bacterium]